MSTAGHKVTAGMLGALCVAGGIAATAVGASQSKVGHTHVVRTAGKEILRVNQPKIHVVK